MGSFFAGRLPCCHSARRGARWWATGRHRGRVLPRIRLLGCDRAGDGRARLSVCHSSRLPIPLLLRDRAYRCARSRHCGSLPVPLLFGLGSVLPVSRSSSAHSETSIILLRQFQLRWPSSSKMRLTQ